MKQHVTPTQMQEITEEQLYSLFDEIVKRKDWANYHHKKMTIGKMIEILHKRSCDIRIESAGQVWYIDNNIPNANEHGYTELCDVLWQAVKQILEDDK